MEYIHQGSEKEFDDAYGNATSEMSMSCTSINLVNGKNEINYTVTSEYQGEKEKKITQIVDETKIIETNTLKSLADEKTILMLPIVEGNRWAEEVCIRDSYYIMRHEIIKIIPETSNNRKRVVVESTIDNMDGYEDNIYSETAVYDKGVGLVYLEMKPLIEVIMSGHSSVRSIQRKELVDGTYKVIDASNVCKNKYNHEIKSK